MIILDPITGNRVAISSDGKVVDFEMARLAAKARQNVRRLMEANEPDDAPPFDAYEMPPIRFQD
jgi:hypothetical protein